ncbi:PREDICTED: serine/arginine repetitive matrix protein 1 [Condylura cristata]|uniref:serine/arginine repetitive matrix protein 1 n=1 Tax=Condylura cristata TaxID=143302 RepID=UPI000643B6A1|nr:PREDICTED: serine/arginine repetitive matrix protein 1 [Condylura cristata]
MSSVVILFMSSTTLGESQRPPELKRAANPASGAGERSSKPRKNRCSSAPTRAPRLSRSAPPPRAASQSPGPAAASSHFHHHPPPPASSSRSAEQRRPRRPQACRCLRLHRPLTERRALLPGPKHRRQPGKSSEKEATEGDFLARNVPNTSDSFIATVPKCQAGDILSPTPTPDTAAAGGFSSPS